MNIRKMVRFLGFIVMLAFVSINAAGAGDRTIVYGTTEKVTDLDPASAYDFHTWEIFYNISQGLLKYPPGKTELVPSLAESYTISPDGREYTFTLREGLKFPDGTPFDAEVVKWSIERVIKLQQEPSWLVTSFVDRVEAVTQDTVKFVLKNPVAYFPVLMATVPYYPVNPNSYPAEKAIHDPSELQGQQLSGLGPYRVVSFTRDQEVILEANPDFYGEKPKNDRVIIRYFPDAAAMRRALEQGELDLAFKTFTPADIRDLEQSKNLVTVKGQGPYIRYLCFLCSEKPFKNRLLRQAIAAAINRPVIMQKVFLGQDEPLYSMTPMGMWSHIDAFQDVYGSDGNLDKAKALLASEGYNEKKPLAFDLWYTPTHYGDAEADLADALKDQLEATGLIKVKLKSAEWKDYQDNQSKKVMSAFLLGWYPDYIDPDNYLDAFAGTEGSKGNGIFFSDPKWDAKLVEAKTVTDMAKRTALYEQIQKMWTDQVMTVPISQGMLYLFTQKHISGVALSPTLELHYSPIERK